MGGIQKAKAGKPIMGRPEKPIDWDLVDSLLMAGCSASEICPHFDMHVDTFYSRVADKYNTTYTNYACEKRQKGDSLLRKVQFNKAIKGDNTMLVWLGKNRMGQKETLDNTNLPPNDKALTELLTELKQNLENRKATSAPESKADPVV